MGIKTIMSDEKTPVQGDDDQKVKRKRETDAEKKAMVTEDEAFGNIASEKIFENDPELAKELAEDRKIQARAQEYKEKKRKRARKKRLIIIISVIVVLIALTTTYFVKKYLDEKAAAENSLTDITISDGEELVYAKITSVAGNEISVSIVEEGDESQAKEEVAGGSASFDKTSDSEAALSSDDEQGPSMGAGSGSSGDMEMSADAGSSGGMEQGPSMGAGSGASGGMEMSAGGGASGSMGQAPSMGEVQGMGSSSSVSYTETGETADYQIPVGTDVITILGTKATFSSLSTGDIIAIALEKDSEVIDKIWIVE